MAIDFAVNDKVVVNQTYVNLTLSALNTATTKVASINLGGMGDSVCNIAAIGNLDYQLAVLSYVRLVPINPLHFFYRNGDGVIIYFENDTQLNNSLELSNAFFGDYIAEKVYNDSGSTLTKGSLVYQTGFDTTVQLATVELASAAAGPTAHFFGILEEDIADGEAGSCLVGGSFIADTSAMAVNDLVYLSDTAGDFSSSSGSVPVIIGRVTTVGAEGSIQVSGEVASQGTGSGAQGATGLRGMTGVQGVTGVQGLGVTGLQGTQGDTGIQGTTGIQGLGVTGLQGIQGDTGVGTQGTTGIQGLTGFYGQTGIQGNTGAGVQGSTGVQGVTGIGGGSSAGAVSVLATVTGINPILGATEIALYSVPASTKSVITQMVMRLDLANGISTTVTAAGGFNAGGANNVFSPVQTTGVTATNDLWTFASQAKAVVGTAGQTYLIGVTGMAGNTSFFSVDVVGYEVEA